MANSLGRWLTWGVVGGLCLAALTAAGTFLVGGGGATELRIVGTTLALAGASGTGLAASTQRERATWLRALGLGASAVALVLLLVLIWAPLDGSRVAFEAVWRGAGVATVLAVAAAHAALLLPRRGGDRPVVVVVVRLTLILIAFVALLLIGGILAEDGPGEGIVRLVGALAVLGALGTLLVPILRRLRPPAGSDDRETGDGGDTPGVAGRRSA